VILTCVSLKIPVLICGKPGTSKTLAVEIASKILSMEFKTKAHLTNFKKSEFSKFWGSLSTTSEGVRKKMNDTIVEQLKK
jgi:DNA polymerase III delta prime subunit